MCKSFPPLPVLAISLKSYNDLHSRFFDVILCSGLKVVGGVMTPSGRLGAFINKVKAGSIADLVGHLRAGDEVLEWNNQSLKGKSFEEVSDIILQSKQDSQVELIVQRDL
ncbi:unnamed protein product [Protopolystoma xenopodis]|uniref:PDZ domain-containing protein n=1 Tax=Protopolystoma xenopodis TaxID=117903 RepID=A0A448XR30_9PLAT|nr:unnamed protein product [Protopolystoma xenopodis]